MGYAAVVDFTFDMKCDICSRAEWVFEPRIAKVNTGTRLAKLVAFGDPDYRC